MATTPKTGILERLNSSLGTVTAIVAGVVGFNTLVTTCSERTIARHSAFHEAVKAEESLWKGLYDEYLGTFEKAIVDDPPRRRAKLYAISNLANHTVPDFREYAVSQGLRSEATQRLLGMRRGLIDALQDSRASGPEVAQASRIAAYAADEATRVHQRDEPQPGGERPQVALAEATPAPGSLSYQTRTLATGSETGWDVDVFWCQGPMEAANFAEAHTVGELIARRSTEGNEVAPGVKLGRVRLRSVPIPLQKAPGDPGRGDVVIFDSGPGERAAATAIHGIIDPHRRAGFRLVRSSGRTSWYLSVFVCP